MAGVLTYLNLFVHIGPSTGRDYPVLIVDWKGGRFHEMMRLPFSGPASEAQLVSLRAKLAAPSAASSTDPGFSSERIARGFGRGLFESLISGEAVGAYEASQRAARDQGRGLRLQLCIEPPELAALPWELLYDPRRAQYVCLTRRSPIVRYLERPSDSAAVTLTPPLRMIAVVCAASSPSPSSADRVALKRRAEDRLVSARLGDGLHVTWLDSPQARDLARTLEAEVCHILYFIGRGATDRLTGQDGVLLSDGAGGLRAFGGSDLGRLLAGHSSLRLVVLDVGASGSLPLALLRAGIPAVVAMQYPTSDAAAADFASAFYQALLQGLDVDSAMSEARVAVSLADQGTLAWGAPVLHMRVADGHLFDIGGSSPARDQRLVNQREQAEESAALESRLARRIETYARSFEGVRSIGEVAAAHQEVLDEDLVGAVGSTLRSFTRISRDVETALSQESAYARRVALTAVETRLNELAGTYAGAPVLRGWRALALGWCQIVKGELEQLVEAVEVRQEIQNPYRPSSPLDEHEETFVGRRDVASRLERFLISPSCPPMLLYGQRRMGKTSLLKNLGRLLPHAIVPIFVDLQGPTSSARDHTGLLSNLVREMGRAALDKRGLVLPALTRDELSADPFTRFAEWLDEVERALGRNTALLMLDEFEALARGFDDGRFEEQQVLGLLRHIIQHRSQFKILLAGSHLIEEYEQWASYLINVQVLPLGYLHDDEARRLIERPVPDFPLRYEPGGVARVIELTRGHPSLLQLLCTEIVSEKNEQDTAVRRLATLADIETAIPAALISGMFFFADIENTQIDAPARTILRFIAARGEGGTAPRAAMAELGMPDLDASLGLLRRRDLIENRDGGWGFQVELIRRWFDPDQ